MSCWRGATWRYQSGTNSRDTVAPGPAAENKDRHIVQLFSIRETDHVQKQFGYCTLVSKKCQLTHEMAAIRKYVGCEKKGCQ